MADAELSLLDRIARAMESIADSLVKLSNPPFLMDEILTDADPKPGNTIYARKRWDFAAGKWEDT